MTSYECVDFIIILSVSPNYDISVVGFMSHVLRLSDPTPRKRWLVRRTQLTWSLDSPENRDNVGGSIGWVNASNINWAPGKSNSGCYQGSREGGCNKLMIPAVWIFFWIFFFWHIRFQLWSWNFTYFLISDLFSSFMSSIIFALAVTHIALSYPSLHPILFNLFIPVLRAFFKK